MNKKLFCYTSPVVLEHTIGILQTFVANCWDSDMFKNSSINPAVMVATYWIYAGGFYAYLALIGLFVKGLHAASMLLIAIAITFLFLAFKYKE